VDKQSNSLIVSASTSEMWDIELLIQQLAGTAAMAEADLRVFKVETADPVAIAKTLNDLFNPRTARQPQAPGQQGGGRRGQQQPGAQPAQPGGGAPQQAAGGAVQAARPTVTIAADARTRSLIVRAEPTEMNLIEKLIKEISAELESEPVVVSTGGYSPMFVEGVPSIQVCNPDLSLIGLRLIYEMNSSER